MIRAGLSGIASVAEALMAPLGAAAMSFGQPRTLAETGHRPWPLPDRPWLMAQSWLDLLFAHWRVPADELAAVLPPQLPVDSYDGSAWLGVTPFWVGAVRLRGLPHVPCVTSFLETNVRTYVTIDGKPGIYFISLDAASRLAVAGARRSHRLPYFHARMSARRAEAVDYHTSRVSGDGPPAELSLRYRPNGARFEAEPGSLEYFLAERYCLYTLDEDRRVLRAHIHHPPWSLQPAVAEIKRNTMGEQVSQPLDGAPLLHMARRQDVLIWSLEAAES
ncbi:MAG: YqjF family protein [Solirubrobacteraceae bacterium]